MPERDVFRRLLRGYAGAGRRLADRRLNAAGVAQSVLPVLIRELNRCGGVPAPYFAELCAVLQAARLEQRHPPLLATAAPAAYAHWQAIRALRRRYGDSPLATVVEDAAAQVLVDERGHTSYPHAGVRRALAQAILTQLFEHDFAGRVGDVLESEGFPPDDARARVDECRRALLGSDQFSALVRALASRPDGRRRRATKTARPKRSTAEIINQTLGDLLTSVTEANP